MGVFLKQTIDDSTGRRMTDGYFVTEK